jgi:hypothetical protein
MEIGVAVLTMVTTFIFILALLGMVLECFAYSLLTTDVRTRTNSAWLKQVTPKMWAVTVSATVLLTVV